MQVSILVFVVLQDLAGTVTWPADLLSYFVLGGVGAEDLLVIGLRIING